MSNNSADHMVRKKQKKEQGWKAAKKAKQKGVIRYRAWVYMAVWAYNSLCGSAVRNNWRVQIEMVAWGQVWWSAPLRITAGHWEAALGCTKSGLEDAKSVALNPVLGGSEDPFEDVRITAAGVLGCVTSLA